MNHPITKDERLVRLLDEWESFIREIEAGYHFGLDDYENDVSTRRLIAEGGIECSSLRRRLGEADACFIAATLEPDSDTKYRIWPGWSDSGAVWYELRLPRRLEGELAADVCEEGSAGAG